MAVSGAALEIEIEIEGAMYRCVGGATRGDGLVETYLVAGVGSVSIASDTGEVVRIAALTLSGAELLARLGPLLHRRESGTYRIR